MKVERVSLLDKDHSCDTCESTWVKSEVEGEDGTWEKPQRTDGFKFGYCTICRECLDGVIEAMSVLDKTKKVRCVEV